MHHIKCAMLICTKASTAHDDSYTNDTFVTELLAISIEYDLKCNFVASMGLGIDYCMTENSNLRHKNEKEKQTKRK